MKRARPKNKKAAEKKQRRYETQKIHESEECTSGQNNKKAKKNGTKKAPKVILITLLVFVVAVFAAMGFGGWFDDSQLLAPLEDGKINVLLMGVDEEGLRTDAVMIASYDANEASVNVLSVPRDTKVYVTNRELTRKFTEIHAMSSKKEKGEIVGAEATAEAVTQLTGIPINYYVEFSFSAIERLFDILGPVEFEVPDIEGNGRGMNYDDPEQNLHIHLKPGLQKLEGNQVQQFLRFRKSNLNKGTGSDTDRVARQQEFVKAVIEQKLNPATMLKLPTVLGQLSKRIKTNITGSVITKYIRYLNKLRSENIHSYSLPGENKKIGKVWYFVCDLEETKALVRDNFGYDAEISDKVTISDEHSQKALIAGNLQSGNTEKNAEDENEKKTDATPEATVKPTTKPETTEETKAPVVTKSPTKAPEVTKNPQKSPYETKTPLEDWDEDEDVIELE